MSENTRSNIMTKITLSAILTAAMLLGSATAMADLSNQSINNLHNISKRPYQQLPDASAYQANESWVGAGVSSGQTAAEASQKQLRLNMLSKRPFM
jgi:uncharacterized membrane protein